MEHSPSDECIVATKVEIARLRRELSDADMALAKIDSGFPDYRKIAAEYFRGLEVVNAGYNNGTSLL